ncbi:MAG: glucose-6-phosphate dehydrogenase [Elusimicrobiota bacterium]
MNSPSRGVSLSIREGLCIEQRPDPCGLVLFGASGDLAERKLFPALNHLSEKGLLPKGFFVVGVARSEMSEAVFRHRAGGFGAAHYLRGDYGDPATYAALAKLLSELDARHGTRGNAIFYLAVPPTLYAEVPRRLQEAGLLQGVRPGGWSRVVIEKPFGRDLDSARALDAELAGLLREDQLYRIDHYLGKETVQNILMFRFANSIFEPVWNRDHVDHVQISVLEEVGVEHRAGYYDGSGVVRDMFQNHMLQLLALVAMDPPSSFDPDRVRDEKVRVLRALKPLPPRELSKCAVLGQYEGYRKEAGVAPGSGTPTYGALRLELDNWRWRGVPFYLRTGKRLSRRGAEIAVRFKSVPHSLFRTLAPADLESNTLVFRIQPDEGIELTFEAKKPGPKLCLGALTMKFDYAEAFGERPPEAYHRLLLDCMLGDPTLFMRRDAVAESWSFLSPLLDPKALVAEAYAPGSAGPARAERLLEADGRRWRTS